MAHRSAIFFGQAPLRAQPSKRALDNPAPSVEAEIRFHDQHVRWFFDSNCVAPGQMLPKNAVKRTVDEYDLHLTQQVVRGGNLVPKGNGGRPVHRIGGQYLTSQHMTQRVAQHQVFTAFN